MRFIGGGGGDDEEYIPTQEELEQAQEEQKPLEKKGGSSLSSNKNNGNSYQKPTGEPYTRLWEGALLRPTPEIGQDFYKGAHIVHTLVEVYDGKNHVFIESGKDPLNGHNILYMCDAKLLDYKQYHPVKGSKGILKI